MSSPFKTVKYRVIFSILAWSVIQMHAMVLIWFGFSNSIAIKDSVISNILLMAIAWEIPVILQFYIPEKNRYAYIVSLCGILTVIWFFVSRMILFNVISENKYDSFFDQSSPIRIAIAVLIIFCMALISVLLYTLQDQRNSEKRKTEAEKLSKEAELFKLRQQLQPHFLFNSLNSINALIVAKPQQARTMIQQLSDFLRGTLRKEENQWITLADELQHLQLYLDIEKVRFGHRLTTEIINETKLEIKLPAMLLQPVVENAIKFGLYDTTENITISISATQKENDLILEVRNPFDATTSASNKGTGFGLDSVQRRLFLLFARQDLLKTAIEDSTFITIIIIPQQ